MRRAGRIAGSLFLFVCMLGVLPQAAKAQSGKFVLIVEENESYENIVGNSDAPYINQLIPQGELFTKYTSASGSGSLQNYLAMTSGLTSALSPPSPNIFQAIDGSGGTVTWKEFEEGMGASCGSTTGAYIPGTSVHQYSSEHDPAYHYQANTTCSANDVPMTTTTFVPSNLPDFSYVVPNQCNDMHTLPGSGQSCPAYFGSNPGTSLVNIGDNWLATVVPTLLAQPNVTVAITWDEANSSTTPPQHIVMLEVGAGVGAGSSDATAYNHYGLEAGLYRNFGLGSAPNNGATATPLPIPSPVPPSPPSVSSFAPTSGWPGTSVAIAGSGFTAATAVTFNGVASKFTVASDSQIRATVPAGASTGPVAVTTASGTATSGDPFTVTAQPAPTVSSLSPASAPVGASVTISGTAFTGATGLTFNGVTAPFTVPSDTKITAAVPSGALTGPVAVTTPLGAASSPGAFGVIPGISSFSPTSGKAGTSVTVVGNAFTGASAVTFNGVASSFTVASDTQITATVPSGASTGRIAVTTIGGTGISSSSFSVRGHR